MVAWAGLPEPMDGLSLSLAGLEENVKRSINELLADRSLQSDSHYVQVRDRPAACSWGSPIIQREQLGAAET